MCRVIDSLRRSCGLILYGSAGAICKARRCDPVMCSDDADETVLGHLSGRAHYATATIGMVCLAVMSLTIATPCFGQAKESFDYLIYNSGNTTYALDGMTNTIAYSASDAATVINHVLSALTAGGSVRLRTGTYNISSTLFINHDGITLAGESSGGLGSLGGARLQIGVYGDVGIRIGDGTHDIHNVTIKNLFMYDWQGDTTTAIHAKRAQHAKFSDLFLDLSVGANSRTGILLDGTGGFSAWNVVENSYITGYQVGIRCTAVINDGCNANAVVNTHLEGYPGPLYGSIGIDMDKGDTNKIFGGDISSYDVGWRITYALNEGHGTRFEGNRVDVLLTAGSSHNRIIGGSIKTVSNSGLDNLFLGSYPFASNAPDKYSALPLCNAATEGVSKPVTNSTTDVWGAIVSAGGAKHVLAYCNGANWTVMAK